MKIAINGKMGIDRESPSQKSMLYLSFYQPQF